MVNDFFVVGQIFFDLELKKILDCKFMFFEKMIEGIEY